MGHKQNTRSFFFWKGVAQRMDYTAWSMAYWEEASRVQERMARVRQEGLPPSPQEEALQRRRLSILYEMYLDCVHTAKDLGRRAQRQEAV